MQTEDFKREEQAFDEDVAAQILVWQEATPEGRARALRRLGYRKLADHLESIGATP